MTKEISAVDLAWLVGLFEGEGYVGLTHQGRPALALGMTDEDIVRKAHAIAGMGTVRPSPSKLPSAKLMWYWRVGRCDDAAALIELMLPHLGKRRGARAQQALESYRNSPPPKRLRTHCGRGHELSPDNVYIGHSRGTPHRSCKRCSLISTRLNRARNPERVLETQRIRRARQRALVAATI